MLAACLAIILGLFIIYLAFNKSPQKDGFQLQDVSAVTQSPPTLPNNDSLLLEGTEVYIFNGPEGAECQGKQKERRRYYTGYEDVYKTTVNRFPAESIRFDLLSPIPYSDAFVAPMGYPHPNISPAPTLSQITYPHPTLPYEMRH